MFYRVSAIKKTESIKTRIIIGFKLLLNSFSGVFTGPGSRPAGPLAVKRRVMVTAEETGAFSPEVDLLNAICSVSQCWKDAAGGMVPIRDVPPGTGGTPPCRG